MFDKLTHFLFLVLVLCFVTTVARADISDGLVAYWPLDEAAGDTTADVTGNGSDGTFVDAPTWVAGKFGSALDFDGSDDAVNCGNQPVLDFGTGEFAISLWLKAITPTGDSTLFGKGGDHDSDALPGVRYQIMFREDDDGDIQPVLDDDSDKFDPDIDTYGDLLDDQWHHIVFMRIKGAGDDVTRVYIDGNEDTAYSGKGEATFPSTYDLSDTSLFNAYIGAITHAGNSTPGSIVLEKHYDGSIDDVAVWNRALTPDEISELWNNGDGNTIAPNVKLAHDPQPENKAMGVDVPSITLSWKVGLDPDDANVPNPNIIEHYLWVSEPYDAANPIIPANPWEAAGTQQFTIAADTNPADGNVDTIASQVLNGLQKDKLYLWVVDEGLVGSSGPLEPDSNKIIWGSVWRFETISSGPVVDANSFVTWLKDGSAVVDLGATATDSSGDLSVIEWLVLTTPFGATVDIADPAVAATTATFTETGTYVLKLYARDAAMHEDEAVIEIKVYNDSCEAAENIPGYTAPEFDFNGDCKEDFLDIVLFAAKWLEDARLPADLRYDAGDITVPFLQINTPLNASVVSGDVIIDVLSYDPGVGTENGNGMDGDGGLDFDIFDVSRTRVQGWHENDAPYDRTWTTAEIDPVTSLPVYPNGVYTIRVTAVSDAGYQIIDEISVTVSN